MEREGQKRNGKEGKGSGKGRTDEEWEGGEGRWKLVCRQVFPISRVRLN